MSYGSNDIIFINILLKENNEFIRFSDICGIVQFIIE